MERTKGCWTREYIFFQMPWQMAKGERTSVPAGEGPQIPIRKASGVKKGLVKVGTQKKAMASPCKSGLSRSTGRRPQWLTKR